MLNEEVKVPALKKIVVASGNKVAMGNNLKEALQNLLSKDASNIEKILIQRGFSKDEIELICYKNYLNAISLVERRKEKEI